MSFPAYPGCKDSEVEWIGNVPEHWEVSRLRNLFLIQKRIAGKLGFDVLSITNKGVKVKDVESGDGQLSSDYSKYQLVMKGEFAMNHMDLVTGYVDISAFDGVTSPDYRVFSVICPELDEPRFLLRLLQNAYHQKLFFPFGQGSAHLGRWRLPAEEFKDFCFPRPSRSEQTQIARFLDHETARIDALIEEQQRLIELLKEKRQAVISHAVTKGLDPTVPMKDSGVEWLGEVPAHWVVSRVKNVASFITSGPRGWSDYIDESGEDIFLQSGDMDNRLNVLFDKAKRIISPEGAEGVRTRLQDGDVVVCITGANTGRVAVLGKVGQAAYVNQHLGLVRPYVLACNSRYLGYALSSSACQTYFNIEQYGLKEGLSLTDIAEAPLMVPPLAEQVKLVEVIENQLGNLDGLTGDSEMTVELLQERRSALISAAVTGKIDVRGWQPPARAQSPELEQEAV